MTVTWGIMMESKVIIIFNIKGIGCITPYYARQLIKNEHISISPCLSEATRSLETSPI